MYYKYIQEPPKIVLVIKKAPYIRQRQPALKAYAQTLEMLNTAALQIRVLRYPLITEYGLTYIGLHVMI